MPIIIEKGGDWFGSYGTPKSKGTKAFALVGRVNNTGLVEVPMGITLRDLIYGIGGGMQRDREFKAVQLVGPSGGCIPAPLLDLPVDFDSLTEQGSMMGVRRNDRHGLPHVHGGYREIFPGFSDGRIVRKVPAMPRRTASAQGSLRQNCRGQRG